MIRVYEDLNLGIYFGILGLFSDFFIFFGFFSIFFCFFCIGFLDFLGDFGIFFVFWDFWGDFGAFFWGFGVRRFFELRTPWLIIIQFIEPLENFK